MIDFLISIDKRIAFENLSATFINTPPIKLSVSNDDLEFLAWGDPIYEVGFEHRLEAQPTVSFIVNNLFGHYYYFLFNKTEKTVFFGNSLFSILPIYFLESNNNIRISNDPLSIPGNGSSLEYNRRFILENILFNYPLFNQSCINGISLLKTNSYFQITPPKIFIIQHTEIINLLSGSKINWKSASPAMAELFIETSKKYFPSEYYASSLTGGFDGRTLVACSLKEKKNFFTFSFGTNKSKDIEIAERLSRISGLDFIRIDLNDNYLYNHSLKNGFDFIKGAYGSASFARAHYQYALKTLSERTRIIITGNFGSEVFRAAHSSGVLISSNLYNLFKSKSIDDAFRSVENSIEWDWINRYGFKNEWESLKEDLTALPCFAYEYECLTKNQQFYKIVFDEILRKYFGAEMINQFRYVSNRTPFIDIIFLKELLNTNLAGVNSDYFTSNPLKRFKGQYLYSTIIDRTYPEFGKEITDKGYCPIDLLNTSGKFRITKSYLQKKIFKVNNSIEDPFAVDSAFNVNKEFWVNYDHKPELFSIDKLNEGIRNSHKNRDSLFIALSQSYFNNEVIGTKKVI